jgi:hypothetical protein
MLRSSSWQKQLVLNIIIGLMLLYMIGMLIMMGIMLGSLLEKSVPDEDPVHIFNSVVLYYFGFEILIRFFMQSLPVLNLETYLTLPVKKRSIVHYVAGKSVFSIGNYLSWLVFIPFAVKMIAPRYPDGIALAWVAGMIMLVFTSNFIATYIKRQLAHKPWVAGLFALGLIGLILLDHFKVLSLSEISRSLMGGILLKPWLLVVPLCTMIGTYAVNFFFLRSRLYPDEISVKKMERADSPMEWRYLKSIGLTGHLISLDIRLLMRHKRTKSLFYMSPIFLLYGLIFYTDDQFKMNGAFPVFVGIFMTGGIMINYLNYCFSYSSGHFDSVLATYTDFRQYLRAKYLMAVSVSTISFFLTIPYVYFGWNILLINTVTFLYNVGFLAFMLLYMSTYSTTRMDLSRSASFNYQGMNATHWLSMLPGFLLPVGILWVCKKLGIPNAGYVLLAVLGISGLVLQKAYLGIVYKQFMRNRYNMAKGFRE